MPSRDRILQRLRSHRAANGSPPSATLPLPLPTPAPVADKISAFIAALEASHADVLRTTDSTWQQDLLNHIACHPIQTLMVAEHGPFHALLSSPPPNLNLVPYGTALEDIKDALFHEIDAGLSYAQAGIAETGTLLLKMGKHEPRALSLVPPTHYVQVAASTLYGTLPEAFADPALQPLPNNMVLISGPSKTADIQQTLAYGAHGPKQLVVLLVE